MVPHNDAAELKCHFCFASVVKPVLVDRSIPIPTLTFAVALGSLVGIIEDPTQLRAETRERIGFMPQNVSLDDDLTVPGRRA